MIKQNSQYQSVLLFIILTMFLSLSIGEHVELVAFLNARKSANFKDKANNIETQLALGVRGEVLETQKFASGNYGLKLKIENGSQSGKSYWVYYNLKAPLIKLIDSKNHEVDSSELGSKDNNKIKKGILTKSQKAIQDPEESAQSDIAQVAKTAAAILDKKVISQMTEVKKSEPCNPFLSRVTEVSEHHYNESDIVEPYRERPTNALKSMVCSTTSAGWDVCKQSGSEKIEAFKLVNYGPNNIVKNNEYYINREMSFEFDDRARSDMRLLVSDSPDETISHTTYSIMMFFPRSVLPAVKKVGETLEVTLPTKEVVKYDAKTKEIIGGVFSEGPMQKDSANRNKAKPANIQYTGAGVLIRADKSGDLPYTDIELSNGKSAPSISIATISKKGFKDCKVPAKDIWSTDQNSGNAFIKESLAKDSGLDAFIKIRCGFSLY